MRDSSKLPADWQMKKLPEVLDFLPGKAHEPYIADVGEYIVANSKFVSTGGKVRKFATQNTSPAMAGDVLIVMSDLPNGRALGKAYLVKEGEKIAVNQRVCALRVRSGDPRFFYYQLDRNPYFLSFDDGINQTHLLNPVFQKCPIAVAPPPEQRKIGEILCAWDEAIETVSRLVGIRERQHLALTHQMVFGKRRLGNFAASRDTAKHRWFNLPSDWTAVPIGELAKEISEKNGDGAATEVLSCSKHEGFVRSLEYFKKQVFSGDLSNYKKIWRGDFGFPSNHIEEGSIGLQGLVDIGVVSPIYTIFRFDADKVDNDYAFAVLKTSLYQHIFEVSTSASVDRRGSLRWKEFGKIPFPLPSLSEQRAISSVLAENRGLVDRLRVERVALDRQKRGLMQKLLTGEWRVKVDDDKEAAA